MVVVLFHHDNLEKLSAVEFVGQTADPAVVFFMSAYIGDTHYLYFGENTQAIESNTNLCPSPQRCGGIVDLLSWGAVVCGGEWFQHA